MGRGATPSHTPLGDTDDTDYKYWQLANGNYRKYYYFCVTLLRAKDLPDLQCASYITIPSHSPARNMHNALAIA